MTQGTICQMVLNWPLGPLLGCPLLIRGAWVPGGAWGTRGQWGLLGLAGPRHGSKRR